MHCLYAQSNLITHLWIDWWLNHTLNNQKMLSVLPFFDLNYVAKTFILNVWSFPIGIVQIAFATIHNLIDLSIHVTLVHRSIWFEMTRTKHFLMQITSWLRYVQRFPLPLTQLIWWIESTFALQSIHKRWVPSIDTFLFSLVPSLHNS